MKRAAVITLLFALSAFNFYCAYSPEFSRRYFPLPIKSEPFLKGIRIMGGVALLLGALLLIYGSFMPTLPEDQS